MSGNQQLLERIKKILKGGIYDKNDLAELIASESDETIERSKSLISHILQGIENIL
jgi:hypothetical protein